MLPSLGDVVSRSFEFELQDSFTFTIPKKKKTQTKKNHKKTIAIYRENKILSRGLYNWAYTLFTAQSLIQKKNITQSAKQMAITCPPFSADKPLQKAVTSRFKTKHG